MKFDPFNLIFLCFLFILYLLMVKGPLNLNITSLGEKLWSVAQILKSTTVVVSYKEKTKIPNQMRKKMNISKNKKRTDGQTHIQTDRQTDRQKHVDTFLGFPESKDRSNKHHWEWNMFMYTCNAKYKDMQRVWQLTLLGYDGSVKRFHTKSVVACFFVYCRL